MIGVTTIAVALGLLFQAGQIVSLRDPGMLSPSTEAVDPGFRSALLSTDAARVDEAGAALNATPHAVAVDWDAARIDAEVQAADPANPVALRPVNARAADLDQVTLPVLLPARDVVALNGATTRLFTRANFYTASVIGNGVLIEVFGTRQHHALPPDPATERRIAEARDADGYLLTQGEGSWEAAFNRYGAAYSVTVECADPLAAPCANGDYARALAAALLIVGGQPETE